MSNWKNPKIFKRFSSIYTFSRNPLLKKDENCHIYIPWNPEIVDDLMFQLKKKIENVGSVYIPYMDLDQKPVKVSKEEVAELNQQIEKSVETHLVMSNFDSVHVFRVIGFIQHKGQDDGNPEKYLDCLSDQKFNYWIEVDDVYVLDANHTGKNEDFEEQLDTLVSQEQTQKIFIAPYKKELEATGVHQKWVEQGRNLTYDYFIRQCELKDNIYQDMWDYLSRNTQHHLIKCELKRNKSVFERGQSKGRLLVESFQAYKNALVSELNEVYILPLVSAIENYECLAEAWEEIQSNGLINRQVTAHIQKILDSKCTQLEDLEDFIFYTKNAKSFFFSLKNMFAKKIHKEEFLLVENFLFKQESLIDSFACRDLHDKVQFIIEIDKWIQDNLAFIDEVTLDELKDLNLKLSHLLSIMASASYHDNIFFKLIEEKAARGTVQKTFEDEVKSLLSLRLQKKSA